MLLITDTWHFSWKSLVGIIDCERKRSCYDSALKQFCTVSSGQIWRCDLYTHV